MKNLGISWAYEKPVFVWDENKRLKVWAPDFYLIPFGIYVEVCGSKNMDKNCFEIKIGISLRRKHG